MPMEEALIDRLQADTAITSLTGMAIHWFEEREGADVGELTLTKISPGQGWDHRGTNGLDQPRVQMDCWAAQPTQAMALARAVIARMTIKEEISGWLFWPGELVDEDWTSLGEQSGGDPLARVRLDFQFFHQEA